MNHRQNSTNVFLTLVMILTISTFSGCTSRPSSEIPNLSYSAFIGELKADNVKDVTLHSDRALVNLKNPARGLESEGLKYRVNLPTTDKEHHDFIQLLQEQNVPFEYEDH